MPGTDAPRTGKVLGVKELDTDFPALLDDAAKTPVLLERDGELFRLARVDEDITYEPDAALVRRTLPATAGSWADLDVESHPTFASGAQ